MDPSVNEAPSSGWCAQGIFSARLSQPCSRCDPRWLRGCRRRAAEDVMWWGGEAVVSLHLQPQSLISRPASILQSPGLEPVAAGQERNCWCRQGWKAARVGNGLAA